MEDVIKYNIYFRRGGLWELESLWQTKVEAL